MITVSKGRLKSRMLEYFRTVERTGEELIVTDHQKPVIKISAIKKHVHIDEVFAPYQGKAVINEPLDTPETDSWEALRS